MALLMLLCLLGNRRPIHEALDGCTPARRADQAWSEPFNTQPMVVTSVSLACLHAPTPHGACVQMRRRNHRNCTRSLFIVMLAHAPTGTSGCAAATATPVPQHSALKYALRGGTLPVAGEAPPPPSVSRDGTPHPYLGQEPFNVRPNGGQVAFDLTRRAC